MKNSNASRGSGILGFLRRKKSDQSGLFRFFDRTTSSDRPSIVSKDSAILLLILGAFVLALIDRENRAAFADLAKVGLAGYVGMQIPAERSD